MKLLSLVVSCALCTNVLADKAPPGKVQFPLGISTHLEAPKRMSAQGALSAAGAFHFEIPAKVRRQDAFDERAFAIGSGRLLRDSGLEDLDASGLEWKEEDAGIHRAKLLVTSREAAQLRVGFRLSSPPASLRIRVAPASNPGLVNEVHRDAIETAAGGGIVWTPPTEGETQLVELTVAGDNPLSRGRLRMIGASHLHRSLDETPKALGDSLSCQLDVACVSSLGALDATTKTAFNNKVNATALMLVTADDGSSGTCSGTLLTNDYLVAIFITAYHCVSSASEANNLVTRWNYQATTCAATQYFTGDLRTGGAVYFAGSQSLDSTVLGLRETPPTYAVLSGWDANGQMPSGSLMLGMHHPRGDLKKTSLGTITGVSGAFTIGSTQYPASSFYTTGWQIGLVEPGSSGSGLFVQPANEDYLAFVGLLNSGPAANLACSAATTYVNRYGRFDTFYPAARRFLRKTYSRNYSDLWWNAAEPGWGVNIQHQGETLFATWFTYAANGQGMWLAMSDGQKIAENVYRGDLYRTTGTPFNQINGAAAFDLPLTQVGSATLSFSSNTAGTFAYTVNGVSGTKAIGRQAFSTPATCEFSLTTRSGNGNYQDLWYNASEPGWGVNLTHQGDTIFATWFTYDANRNGLWLVMSNGVRNASGAYQGTLYRTTGTPFNLINGSAAANFPLTEVGTLSLRFIDGQNADMSYTVNGLSGTKRISRQVFASPHSSCR